MIQYSGITLFRDEDGLPMQLTIDLRIHGRELESFMRTHKLLAVEQADVARSITGESMVPSYGQSGTPQPHVRYLPDVRKCISSELDRLFSNKRLKPEGLTRKESDGILVNGIERNLTPIPRKKESAPEAFSRYCGKDTFWVRFRISTMGRTLWYVFYTVHDDGIVLVRHLSAFMGDEDDLS